MFISFLIANLLVAILVCAVIALPFRSSLLKYLKSRFSEEASVVWARYLVLAIFIIGISVGTRVWDLEKFVSSTDSIVLTPDLAALEIYKTTIATLQIVATLLFVILVVAWISSLIKKNRENVS